MKKIIIPHWFQNHIERGNIDTVNTKKNMTVDSPGLVQALQLKVARLN